MLEAAADAGGAARQIVGCAAESDAGLEVHQVFVVTRDQRHFIHLRAVDQARRGRVLQVELRFGRGNRNCFVFAARYHDLINGKCVGGMQHESGNGLRFEVVRRDCDRICARWRG